VKASTLADRRTQSKAGSFPAIGALSLRRVTLWQIAKLHNELLTTGSRDERRGGLALKTVRNTGRVLTKAFGAG